jgi:protein CrcB
MLCLNSGNGFCLPARVNRTARPLLMTPAHHRNIMQLYLLIAPGSVLQFFLSGLLAVHGGEMFPWGTLVINITGSFAIGLFSTLTGPDGRRFVGAEGRPLFMAGICGGYTASSSFSLQTPSLTATAPNPESFAKP